MKRHPDIKIGEEFRPSLQLKTRYYIDYFLIIFIFILPWYIPLFLFAPFIATAVISAFLLLILLPVLYWIPKYYRTILYRLTGNEMTWRRGVWFKNTGIVPYNRITNIDISQGPISRALGIAALKIQTAGYSAPSGRTSEIKLEGIKNFEELRETIMGFVRGRKPVAVETFEEDTSTRVLDELVKIRKLLERGSKR